MRDFLKQERGGALIEFAFILPILLLLFLGSIELTRYIMIKQKVEKTSYTMADLIARYPAATTPPKSGQINNAEVLRVLNFYNDLMDPFLVAANGIACISSIQQVGDPDHFDPLIRWQVAAGGTLSSQISSVSSQDLSTISPGSVQNQPVRFSAEMASTFTYAGQMRQNENIIIVEVWYQYYPMLGQTWFPMEAGIIKSTAFFTPRTNTPFTTLPPDFM